MRIPRSTGAISGVLVGLLGLWGALIPFVGPYFDYSFGSNSTWHYTTNRLVLDILPGALALVAGGLLLMARTRRVGVFGGWLGLLAGAWFVIGPAVSLTWEHGGVPIGRPLGGSTRQMLELIGYFYGLGALIIALVAFASGRFAFRPAVVEKPAVVERPAVPQEPAAVAPASVFGPADADAGASSSPSASGYAVRPARFSLRRRSGGPVGSRRVGRSAGGPGDS